MADQPTHSELIESLARSEAREALSRHEAFAAGAWLAAIVENSDDAILSKTLDGVILTWNGGAERLFGYTAEEAIGRPITIIIPESRLHEEEAISGELRAGRRVDNLETVRRRKNGGLIDIALTVSPVKDEAGKVLGASKIARDISAIKQAAAHQDLVIREMNHRIKNLFALTSSLVSLSARAAIGPIDLARDLTARLQALSRAHALMLSDPDDVATAQVGTTLKALIREILSPYDDAEHSRITIDGAPVPVGHQAVPTLGLLFHELATNAAKYGALASTTGCLHVGVTIAEDVVEVCWRETDGFRRQKIVPQKQGFGSRLEQASIASLGGTIERHWYDQGLEVVVRYPTAAII